MAYDLITLGDLVLDLVVPIDKLPLEANQHQTAQFIRMEAGGVGNTLIMANRLGMTIKALGSVGDDEFGHQVLKMLAAEGIDVSSVVELPNSATTTSVVVVDNQAQHVFMGMFGTGEPLDFVFEWQQDICEARALFLSGYSLRQKGSMSYEGLMKCIQVGHEANVPLFFDLGPAYAAAERTYVEDVLAYTSVFLATAEEITEWCGISDLLQAAQHLLHYTHPEKFHATSSQARMGQNFSGNLYAPSTVVIKLGAAGCRIITQSQDIHCPGFEVVVRDTAGAGDAFAAAYIYGHLQGFALPKIGQFANAVGAVAVAKLGTGSSLPSLNELKTLLSQHDIQVELK